ncbi:amino acid kinase family protein [Methyloversatilis thermotolerans]|uniref:amino acid kinase family protein n=1 Tax=Methyloversatilis thermotolerans TaxID=1346290 RepID=UPI0003669FEA|nr:hypothetical protein [Methyloversatilis thermotolerans]
MRAPLVIKLGGSLLSQPEDGRLRRWCDAIACGRFGRCIVVPGGGPFADAVRDAQARWRFSDDAAHRMALLAMDQVGRLLADLQPALATVDDMARLAAGEVDGRAQIWLPHAALADSSALPRDWSVTSDSIAAWLAAELGGRARLVKSCAVPDRPLAELATLGIVDRHLPVLAASRGVVIELVHADPLDP